MENQIGIFYKAFELRDILQLKTVGQCEMND